jgi:pimeloyl-ACP methyl ester carboxylesterase
MNGTRPGDRFHDLTDAVRAEFPEANVYLLDWSPLSTARTSWGLPNPWEVAQRIDEVGEQAARLMQEEGLNPESLTLIGESFGAYVNHVAATALTGVRSAIALNPASEAGGYSPPDLRQSADFTVAYCTDSPFDTRLPIAEHMVAMELPPGMDAVAKHTSGVRWLQTAVHQVGSADAPHTSLSVALASARRSNPSNISTSTSEKEASGNLAKH